MTSGALVDLDAVMRSALADLYPDGDVRSRFRRFKFRCLFHLHRQFLDSLLDAEGAASLGRAMMSRPGVLGMLLWPYINKDWGLEQRFSAFAAHYRQADLTPMLALDVNESLVVANLSAIQEGLHLVIDRPKWFLREGELSINLFLDGERIYSIAFSLGSSEGKFVAYIGGIQGRSIGGIDIIYKELTKKLYGTRPRDFLVAVFQVLCDAIGVERLLAVSDECRHHRHRYFGSGNKKVASANYDAIWSDRGGKPIAGGFFELPVQLTFKDESQIPPQKRAQYRRRYALYDQVRRVITDRLAGRL